MDRRENMRWISVCLIGLVAAGPMPCRAQEAAGAGLNIAIVEGEGAINNIRQRTARAPIVQVEDENRRPVAGAAVVFMLPERGATGVFPNGSRTLTVTTDNQGRAVARGIRVNNVQGNMDIRVTASHQGQTATATITQVNSVLAAGAAGAGMGLGMKLLIVAGAATAAAVTGAVVATGGNDTPATRPPTTVTPGSGNVGAPRP
jgi:hypothetical protein